MIFHTCLQSCQTFIFTTTRWICMVLQIKETWFSCFGGIDYCVNFCIVFYQNGSRNRTVGPIFSRTDSGATCEGVRPYPHFLVDVGCTLQHFWPIVLIVAFVSSQRPKGTNDLFSTDTTNERTKTRQNVTTTRPTKRRTSIVHALLAFATGRRLTISSQSPGPAKAR